MAPVVWLTGLSGSGKSTICRAVREELLKQGARVAILDADEVRKNLCQDLGYTAADRKLNLLRISYVAKLLAEQDVIVLVAAIAPYQEVRQEIRRSHARFIEVFVNAPLGVCEQRDPKGLYGKARAGLISNFTGISDPYEPPGNPDVECRTDIEEIEDSCKKVLRAII
jgi:adenylylsulfate kinase